MPVAADNENAVRILSVCQNLVHHISLTLLISSCLFSARKHVTRVILRWYFALLPFLGRHFNVGVAAVFLSAYCLYNTGFLAVCFFTYKSNSVLPNVLSDQLSKVLFLTLNKLQVRFS